MVAMILSHKDIVAGIRVSDKYAPSDTVHILRWIIMYLKEAGENAVYMMDGIVIGFSYICRNEIYDTSVKAMH